MRISVVIPTYNSEATLYECLESIKNQTYPCHETIIVDGGSLDSTTLIALRHGARVINSVANRSAQRNAGANDATGDYLFFVDSDMVVSNSCLADAVGELERGYDALIIPEVSVGAGFWANVKSFERSFYQGVWWMEAARITSKALFSSLGGYDTRLIGAEDWDLNQRIRERTNIGRTNSVIHHNEGQQTLKKIMVKKRHYGTTLIEYAQKHPAVSKIQFSVIRRVGLFVSRPKQLLTHPLLACGIAVLGLMEYWASKYAITAPNTSERPI